MDDFNVSEILKIQPISDQRKERAWIKLKSKKKHTKKIEKEENIQKKKKSDGIIDIYA